MRVASRRMVDANTAATDSAVEQGSSEMSCQVYSPSPGGAITAHTGVVDADAEEGESAIELLEERWNSDSEFFTPNQVAASISASQTGSAPDLSGMTASTLFNIHREAPSSIIDLSRGTASATLSLLDDISDKLSEISVKSIIPKKTLLDVVEAVAKDFIAEHPNRFTVEDDADEDSINVPKAKQSADAVHSILKDNLRDTVVADDTTPTLVLLGIDRVRKYMRLWAMERTSNTDELVMSSTPTKAPSSVSKTAHKCNTTDTYIPESSSPLDDAVQPKKKKTRQVAAAGAGPRPWSLAEDLQIIRMKTDSKGWNEKGASDSISSHRQKVFHSWRRSMGLPFERTWDAMEQYLNKLTKRDNITASQLEKQLGVQAGEEITKVIVDKHPATTSSKTNSPISSMTPEENKKTD